MVIIIGGLSKVNYQKLTIEGGLSKVDYHMRIIIGGLWIDVFDDFMFTLKLKIHSYTLRHYVITGPEDSPYAGGEYWGWFTLPIHS